MLTGSHPYPADAIEAIIYKHLHSPVPDTRRKRKDLGAETAAVVRRMMAKRAEKRFQSYSEVLEALHLAYANCEERTG